MLVHCPFALNSQKQWPQPIASVDPEFWRAALISMWCLEALVRSTVAGNLPSWVNISHCVSLLSGVSLMVQLAHLCGIQCLPLLGRNIKICMLLQAVQSIKFIISHITWIEWSSKCIHQLEKSISGTVQLWFLSCCCSHLEGCNHISGWRAGLAPFFSRSNDCSIEIIHPICFVQLFLCFLCHLNVWIGGREKQLLCHFS